MTALLAQLHHILAPWDDLAADELMANFIAPQSRPAGASSLLWTSPASGETEHHATQQHALMAPSSSGHVGLPERLGSLEHTRHGILCPSAAGSHPAAITSGQDQHFNGSISTGITELSSDLTSEKRRRFDPGAAAALKKKHSTSLSNSHSPSPGDSHHDGHNAAMASSRTTQTAGVSTPRSLNQTSSGAPQNTVRNGGIKNNSSQAQTHHGSNHNTIQNTDTDGSAHSSSTAHKMPSGNAKDLFYGSSSVPQQPSSAGVGAGTDRYHSPCSANEEITATQELFAGLNGSRLIPSMALDTTMDAGSVTGAATGGSVEGRHSPPTDVFDITASSTCGSPGGAHGARGGGAGLACFSPQSPARAKGGSLQQPVPPQFAAPVPNGRPLPPAPPTLFHHQDGREGYANTGKSLNKLELSRACVAVFLSNSGVYRPVLQKVFSFLFDYIDFLVTERHQLMNQPVAGSGCAKPLVSDEEPNETIANAYQKVRLMEVKMMELVEEASVQRDRFKAQIASHEREEDRLQMLLTHQIELTHMMYEYTDSKGIPLFTTDPDTGLQVGLPGKNRAYVQRLIAQAEREHVLDEVQKKLSVVTEEVRQLQEVNSGLRKLNSKYARQAAELSARISILLEHNIGLGADIQLYQRDLVREQQQTERFHRELTVARSMIITLLETRATDALYQSGARSVAAVQELDPIAAVAARSNGLEVSTATTPKHSPSTAAVLASVYSPSSGSTAASSPVHFQAASPSQTTGSPRTRNSRVSVVSPPVPPPALEKDLSVSFTEETHTMQKIGQALSVIQDKQLRLQLKDILSINDAVAGGATKTALLNILNLKRANEAFGMERGFLRPTEDPTTTTQGEEDTTPQQMVSVVRPSGDTQGGFTQRLWVPPMGRAPRVPRHLRSRHSVSIIPFHPLVAECFVHEILSQRQEWIDRSLQAKQSECELDDRPFVYEPEESMALEDFIQLFVNVIWLNREDRFLPLLPDEVRLEIVENSRRTERRLNPAPALSMKAPSPPKKMSVAYSPTTTNHHQENFATASPRKNSSRRIEKPMMSPAEIARKNQISSSLTPAMRCRLHCLLHSIKPSEKLLRLPMEGLRLTYSLDIASRRTDAGFLTYAYGIVSRLRVGEVLFDVMRNDRDVFLQLCKLVDQHRENARAAEFEEAKKAVLRERAKANMEALTSEQAQPAESSVRSSAADLRAAEHKRIRERDHKWTLRGCIPLVSIAQILMAMYPTYPVKRIEQLVIAASEDGTDSSESPVMIYYSLLLPERLLPGVPTSTNEPMSFWRSGAFSSLFFLSISDDALESLQMVEDSFANFGRSFTEQTERGGEERTTANPTATARQLVTVGMQGIQYEELQKWRLGLESIFFTWSRLQVAFFEDDFEEDSEHHEKGEQRAPESGAARTTRQREGKKPRRRRSAAAKRRKPSLPATGPSPILGLAEASGGNDFASPFLEEEEEKSAIEDMAAQASTTARVPVMDAVMYLRQHIVLRRGPNAYQTLPPELTETRGLRTPRSPSPALSHSPSFSHTPSSRGGGGGVAAARESDFLNVSLSTTLQRETLAEQLDSAPPEGSGWGEEHMNYIRLLMKRWVKYCAGDESPVLPASAIIEKLREIDPNREKVWTSPQVGFNNPYVHFVDPTKDWKMRVVDVDEVAAEALKLSMRMARRANHIPATYRSDASPLSNATAAVNKPKPKENSAANSVAQSEDKKKGTS